MVFTEYFLCYLVPNLQCLMPTLRYIVPTLRYHVPTLRYLVLPCDTCATLESGSFRPWVVSVWVVSANFWDGSFRPKKVSRCGPGSFRP